MKYFTLKSSIILGILTFLFNTHGQCAQQTGYYEPEVYEREITVPSYIQKTSNEYTVSQSQFMNPSETNYDSEIENTQQKMKYANPGIEFAKKPVIACRTTGCTRLNDRISRNFLFNSLSNIFMMNAYSKLYICEADPFTRACIQSGINFPAKIGIADAIVKIPYAQVSQVLLSRGISKTQIELTYPFLVNGVEKQCKKTLADIVIPNDEQVTLYNKDFTCRLTSDAKTNVSLLLNIDYIDLDYGIIGGYYSFGMQGPAQGGGTGYVLFKTQYSTKQNSQQYNNIKEGTVQVTSYQGNK